MFISRRDFIQAAALSGSGLVFEEFVLSQRALAAQGLGGKQDWPLSPQYRTVLNLNQKWRFLRVEDSDTKGATSEPVATMPAEDARWEEINLPHTVRLEPLNASGGVNFQGICWYEKQLTVDPVWHNRTVHLVFQGAMQVADVWLNNTHLTTHWGGGYVPFVLDISSHLDYSPGARNQLRVRLNNSDNPEVPPGKPQNTLDFVYFGGLYRSVELRVMDQVHLSDPLLAGKPAGGGVFVTFDAVSAESATVRIQTDIENTSASSAHVIVRQQLHAADNSVAASAEVTAEIAANSSHTFSQTIAVRRPLLWHPFHPHLYRLHTVVLRNGNPADDQQTRIGIRTFSLDKDRGLSINGEPFFSIGANRHQDHPYVGYALPASAHYRDAWKLRDAGFTSYRCHYPQDPAFMDACDELGILGIVSNPGWQFMGNNIFRERVYQNARTMIRRDRNRPCVLLWEAQMNETDNSTVAAELQRIVHEEYPGPQCYSAGDRVTANIPGFTGWDVEYSRNDGSKPLWVREWGDQVDNWSDQQGSVRVAREWGETPMLVQMARHTGALNGLFEKQDAPLAQGESRASGADLWAGIDYYRGYHQQPFYGSPLDLFRLPKFDHFLFKSQRPASPKTSTSGAGPMVFVANFASFQSPVTVVVFSNCDEVKLTQNGKEVATQKPDAGYKLPHPPFTFHLEQFSELHSMLFASGVAKAGTIIGHVKAEGLIDGNVVATHEVYAPGVPAQLKLELDDCGRELTADGADWIRVHAYVCDARGTTYLYGDDEVTFAVKGEGQLITNARIGNNPARALAGIATGLVQATTRAGEIIIEASAPALQPATLRLASKAPL